MKLIHFIPTVLISLFLWGENIYDINIQLVSSGQPVSMSSFAGKKIIIATISAADPDTAKLKMFDSLQAADKSLAVIVVPVSDEIISANDRNISKLQKSMTTKLIITKSYRAKKDAGSNQYALFRWLTNATANGHFDTDLKEAGQLFIISRSGTLYAVLESNVPVNVLTRVLKQELVK